jgi:hypothetical protein
MNEQLDWLEWVASLQQDPRIGPMHISLYVSILCQWRAQGLPNPVRVNAGTLMPGAKIRGKGPYHRTIRQLHEYGYIKYEPSYNPEWPSKVYVIESPF